MLMLAPCLVLIFSDISTVLVKAYISMERVMIICRLHRKAVQYTNVQV